MVISSSGLEPNASSNANQKEVVIGRRGARADTSVFLIRMAARVRPASKGFPAMMVNQIVHGIQQCSALK